MNRVTAGYALTRNPMNPAQLSRVPLTPDVVDCIVFWTKDPAPMLDNLQTLDHLGYRYYFHFTLTPYDRDAEPGLRPKDELARTFAELSRRIGKARVLWRYDPILMSDRYTLSWHREQFRRYCEKLSQFTDSVTISFLDIYGKLKCLPFRAPDGAEMAELSCFIGETAKAYGLTPYACCEAMDLSPYGIERGHCVDKALIECISGGRLKGKPDTGQRLGCGCWESVDLGAYNTCPNGCLYCYANRSTAGMQQNYASHSPEGELLLGEVQAGEIARERSASSLLEFQITLF